MPTEGTKRRSIRIEDGLWTLAKDKADKQGDNLSEIIRQALVNYLKEEGQQ